jgi:serine/threonine protein kinase/dipeptidyl aminopeptidase/acylaminoacyl peptidase
LQYNDPHLIGQTLAHFRITAKLGSGGMGDVYRAEDTKLDREVALKILPPDLVQNPDRVRRFVQEAKSASALSHPYIVTIHEIGEENGVHYIAMELVDGGTLKHKIHTEQVPFKQVLGWLAQSAEGLAKAHSAGIIHRDLKPDNIMITRDGFAKVLDFGLAKLTEPLGGDGSQAQTGLSDETAAGAVLGTVGYMSPEQVQGKSIDPRSDVFAFGCILYEAATRQRPFAGETAVDTMHQILRSDPPPVKEISPETPSVVRRLIRRTLAKDPEQRFQSMRDLAFELSDLAEEYDELSVRTDSQTVSSSGVLAPISDDTKAKWPLRIGGFAAVLIALGSLAFWLLRDRAGRTPTGAPTQATFSQLTYEAGHESDPDFSPDGNFVVYAGSSGTETDLFLLRVGGTNPINLTQTPEIREWSPAYSPDGQTIAFASSRDGGGIFVMGSTGEAARRLTDFGSDPSWSPDGSSIVFASETFSTPDDRGNFSRLFVTPATGGAASEIYAEDAVQPDWSPHGERIAFWALRGDGGVRDIATTPANGGEAVWVTDDPALDWNPIWSADGDWLYFASDRGGSMNLWRVAIDERSGEVLSEPEALTTPSTSLGWFALSQDGQRVVYTHRELSTSIERRSFDPDSLEVGDEATPLLSSGIPFLWVNLSPDGERIVLGSQGSIDDLYLANTDGTGLQRLTNDQAKNRGPRWTPDGASIVFYSDRSGSYQTWRIQPDGSGLQQLTDTKETNLWPAISPDGRYLLAPDMVDGTNVMDLTGSLPTREVIARARAGDSGSIFFGTAWSPDSSQIVGTLIDKQAFGQRAIVSYSLTQDSSEVVYRVGSEATVFDPVWLPEGNGIVFVRFQPDGQGALMVMNPDGSDPRPIWTFEEDSDPSISVSFENRSLLLLTVRRSSDLWLATFE